MEILLLIIGLQLGWYARTMKDIVSIGVSNLRDRLERERERRNDQSGVVQGGTVRQKGKIVDLPSYSGTLVRSPTPKQIKLQQQRAHEQDLMNL